MSERVEIGKALEAEMRDQAEKRMKAGTANPVENFPEGGRTRDLAAKAAGFGTGKTYEQAKSVIERGFAQTLRRSVFSGTDPSF